MLFVIRTILMACIIFNLQLHFQEDLSLGFMLFVLLFSASLAAILEQLNWRLHMGFLVSFAALILLRYVIFLIMGFAARLDQSIERDFFYFYFDKDFFPSMVIFFLAWPLFFLGQRYYRFTAFEALIRAVFLILVFMTEANYNLTLYHPTVFTLILGTYIFLELAYLILSFRGFHKKDFFAKGHGKKFLALAGLIPVLLLIFFVYSYFMNQYNNESTKSRGGLMESTLFRFDFSKYIKLESEIELSDDLVMVFRKNGPASRILLRRHVLSEYRPGQGFFLNEDIKRDNIPRYIPETRGILDDPGYKKRKPVDQEYYLVNIDPSSLIAMNYPTEIVPMKNWDQSSFLRIYTAQSQVSQVMLEGLDVKVKDIDMLPEDLAYYTEYGDDEMVHDLALAVTEKEDDYLSKVRRINEYLQTHYLYSLKPGIALDGNQLHHFLFSSKKGYCSYFAFSMALMCRSIGIPARVAVGFVANPEWEVLNFYEIRANLAHAWVEVYFGDLGWIEFDPTSSELAPGEDISFAFGFDFSDELKDLLNEILDKQNQLEPMENLADKAVESFDWEKQVERFGSWFLRSWYYLLLALFITYLLMIKFGPLLRILIEKDPRKKLKLRFHHGLRFLYWSGLGKKSNESYLEFAGRLQDQTQLDGLEAWIQLYLKSQFGEVFSTEETKEAVKAEKLFRRKLNPRIKWYKKILGFLNPVFPNVRRGL